VTTPELLAESVAALQQTPALHAEAWRYRPATVIVGNSVALMVQFDGEGFEGSANVAVPATLLTGTAAPGDRVLVQSVPPNLNFVINNLSRGPGPSCESVDAVADSQSFNDNDFHDILVGGVALTMTFVKYYMTSRIHVQQQVGGFVGTTNTGIRGGVQLNGTDYDGAQVFFNATGDHQSATASFFIPDDMPAGSYDVVIRYRRYAGAGTVNVDGNDQYTCTLTEST
jgi:hypothetical protein